MTAPDVPNQVSRRNCPTCGGRGLRRNPKHFFWGVSLIASGMLVFFQWPPIPDLIAAFENFAVYVGLRADVGTVAIWTLAGVPSVFGLAFLYSWSARDTCPECGGTGRASPPA